MSELLEGIRFLVENSDEAMVQFWEHLVLVAVSEFAALAVAIPAAILAVRNDRARSIVLGFGNAAQTIPTIAILFLAFPLIGLGFWPSIVGLWAYAILPIIVNTIKGIENVDEGTVEAARGMGMTDWEILRSIQLPLALPVIFAGIRTSIVLVIGTAYLAVFIGGGGLGYWVVAGIQGYNVPMIIAGALPGAFLAIGADLLLARIERYIGGEGGVGDLTPDAA
ncbi:ABC transporter permease [Natrialbaceae archaeon AArc-T1-2]|nr:ABC transporter permease [Natrialbaceae archaeon AArc-T1-2]WIV66405.1 ABC transporter permease [Natrialbaceae archaeon AArc-T1-2]